MDPVIRRHPIRNPACHDLTPGVLGCPFLDKLRTKQKPCILSLSTSQRKDFELPEDDQNQRLGRYVVKTYEKETVRAFVPPLLPPDPPIRLDGLQRVLEQANQALGRLDGLASILPD